LDFKNAFKIAEKYHAEAQRAEASNLDFSKCDSWCEFTTKLELFSKKIFELLCSACFLIRQSRIFKTEKFSIPFFERRAQNFLKN